MVLQSGRRHRVLPKLASCDHLTWPIPWPKKQKRFREKSTACCRSPPELYSQHHWLSSRDDWEVQLNHIYEFSLAGFATHFSKGIPEPADKYLMGLRRNYTPKEISRPLNVEEARYLVSVVSRLYKNDLIALGYAEDEYQMSLSLVEKVTRT